MLYQKAGAMPRSSFSKRELLTVVLCMLICSLVDFAEMLGGYYIGAGTHVAVTNERSSKDRAEIQQRHVPSSCAQYTAVWGRCSPAGDASLIQVLLRHGITNSRQLSILT